MKCPLRQIPKPPGDIPGKADTSCLQTLCAWWDDRHGICGLLSLCQDLRRIDGSIHDLYNIISTRDVPR